MSRSVRQQIAACRALRATGIQFARPVNDVPTLVIRNGNDGGCQGLIVDELVRLSWLVKSIPSRTTDDRDAKRVLGSTLRGLESVLRWWGTGGGRRVPTISWLADSTYGLRASPPLCGDAEPHNRKAARATLDLARRLADRHAGKRRRRLAAQPVVDLAAYRRQRGDALTSPAS